jgi:hypothetical protein
MIIFGSPLLRAWQIAAVLCSPKQCRLLQRHTVVSHQRFSRLRQAVQARGIWHINRWTLTFWSCGPVWPRAVESRDWC